MILSIVIPTHNRPLELKRAIKSIDTFVDDYQVEIIIVNDGSTLSYEGVRECLDPKVKYIHHLESKGVSAARNTGVQNAIGAWILFLDDDDEFTNNYISHLFSILKCENNEFDFFWCSILKHIYVSETFVNPKVLRYLDDGDIYTTAATIGASYGLGIRRSEYNKLGGFSENFLVAEDTEFLIRMLSSGLRPKIINKVGILKHDHESDRLSGSFKKYSELKVYEKIFDAHLVYLSKNIKTFTQLLYWASRVHYEFGDYRSGDALRNTLAVLIFKDVRGISLQIWRLIQLKVFKKRSDLVDALFK